MKKMIILILGLFSIWPLFYIAFFIISSFTNIGQRVDQSNSALDPTIQILFFLTMAITYIIMILYIVFLFRTDRIKGDRRALWAVVIFFGNIIALPIFWYLYFFRYTFLKVTDSYEDKF